MEKKHIQITIQKRNNICYKSILVRIFDRLNVEGEDIIEYEHKAKETAEK